MEYLSVKKNKKGFTIPEVLIAVTVLMFIFGSTLLFYSTCYASWRKEIASLSLQRRASTAMEKVILGLKVGGETEQNGIKEAKSFTIPDTNTVRFVSGLDNYERSFYLENNDIIYDPDTSVAFDEVVAVKNVQNLEFEKLSPRRLKISMLLDKYINNKLVKLKLATEVTIRNQEE